MKREKDAYIVKRRAEGWKLERVPEHERDENGLPWWRWVKVKGDE